MNAILHRRRIAPTDVQPSQTSKPEKARAHRYDSIAQERIAKRVLQKHEVALRALAK